MIHREFELRYGEAWASTRAAADPDDDYFERNLDAMRLALEAGPYAYSQPFLTDRDDMRVFATTDAAAGYRLVVFFRVDGAKCILEWIDRTDL